jgi:D-3-phosphoglycerate dehydrogenase
LSKRTVAELTLAFIFALARRLVPMHQDLQQGHWRRQDAVNIAGKTLGILGLGAIGGEVAKLGLAVGMRVLAYDLAPLDGQLIQLGVERASRDGVIREADFLTLHLPLTPKTKNVINSKTIAKMKPGAYLVNLARGEVVDERALLGALECGHLAGAGLDVFSVEPPFRNQILARLLEMPQVIATPHVGAFTQETRYALAKHICGTLVKFAG